MRTKAIVQPVAMGPVDGRCRCSREQMPATEDEGVAGPPSTQIADRVQRSSGRQCRAWWASVSLVSPQVACEGMER